MHALEPKPEVCDDQFILSLRDTFPSAIQDLLEHEVVLGRKEPLEERFRFMLNRARMLDRTKNLMKARDPSNMVAELRLDQGNPGKGTVDQKSAEPIDKKDTDWKPPYGVCYRCQDPGHWAFQCPLPYPSSFRGGKGRGERRDSRRTPERYSRERDSGRRFQDDRPRSMSRERFPQQHRFEGRRPDGQRKQDDGDTPEKKKKPVVDRSEQLEKKKVSSEKTVKQPKPVPHAVHAVVAQDSDEDGRESSPDSDQE